MLYLSCVKGRFNIHDITTLWPCVFMIFTLDYVDMCGFHCNRRFTNVICTGRVQGSGAESQIYEKSAFVRPGIREHFVFSSKES